MAPTTASLLNLALAAFSSAKTPAPFNPGFNISAVYEVAKALPSHSWEFGAATQALLEYESPLLSVYGPNPFPVRKHDPATVPALAYAQEKIVVGTGIDGLSPSAGAVGDPASLAIGAWMLGKTNETFATATKSEIDYVLNDAPRYANGAISQRGDVGELWADYVWMFPPSLAFYAADIGDVDLLELAYRDCGLQRQVLLFLDNSSTPSAPFTSTTNGSWHHIIGPQSYEPGLWSTGNGWAAGGMARILATIMKAPVAKHAPWKKEAITDLTNWIKEIVDGAIASPHEPGLLRNYLNDTVSAHGFPEISGSSLLAATALRMAVLAPETFGQEYIDWANEIRCTLGKVDENGEPVHVINGVVTPAVNPLGWGDTAPWTTGSPEGNVFVVLLYSAWRDCIYAGLCEKP